jgi:hypothetical protein
MKKNANTAKKRGGFDLFAHSLCVLISYIAITKTKTIDTYLSQKNELSWSPENRIAAEANKRAKNTTHTKHGK